MIILAPDDVAPLIARGIKEALDSDEWAVARLAELRADGERATAVVQWAPAPAPSSSGFAFAVKIRRADGSIESPPAPSSSGAPLRTFEPSHRCQACGGWRYEHTGPELACLDYSGTPQKGSSR